MNIGIILAAGNSTRFNDETPKQLYLIDDKPVINHSIDILEKFFDDIIIVANTHCSDKIKTNHTVLINDIDNRIESIKVAIDYIGEKENDNKPFGYSIICYILFMSFSLECWIACIQSVWN
jgi:2-C-methyl-D-erythritol 4-phosphate cytidylyltransferase